MTNNYCISNKLHTDFLLLPPGWESAEADGIINDGLVGNDTDQVLFVVK